jgi:hypothetical protein
MIPSQQSEKALETKRVKSRETFLYFLDQEVMRARRYREFFSIILLKLLGSDHFPSDVATESCCKTLTDVLVSETRETDILGTLEKNKIAVLLPYADQESSGLAQSRFKLFLRPYDFKRRGWEVELRRLCFPSDGTDTRDLVEKF